MAQQKSSFPKAANLPETTFQQQHERQQLHGRQPNGLDRYPYMKALQDQMSVIDGLGINPDRFTPVSPCMGTLDCTCGQKGHTH